MHRVSDAAFLLCLHAGVSTAASAPRELVHPFPPTGPFEVAGATPANRVLRAMQRYAVPPLTDTLATHVAHTLQGASDAPVIVTRRHRRSGGEAMDAVSSAAADGRTLLLATGAARGLRPVAAVASMPYVLIVPGGSVPASLQDFLREARKAPGRSFIASVGERSPAHSAIRLFRREGLPIDPLAYNGGHAALQAVASKHVSAALVPLPAALPYLPAGRIRALVLTEARRHPALAHVPTSAESGLSDFAATTTFSVFAPSATPTAVIRDLDTRLGRVADSEPARQTFYELGLRLEHHTGVIPDLTTDRM